MKNTYIWILGSVMSLALGTGLAYSEPGLTLQSDLSVPAAKTPEDKIRVVPSGGASSHDDWVIDVNAGKEVPDGKSKAGQTLSPNEMLIQAQSAKDWVEGGIARTSKILAVAKDARTSFSAIFVNVKGALSRSTVRWPNPGYNFNHCIEKPAVLAFVILGTTEINLCRRVIDEAWFQEKELAQTLAHEASHVQGYGNECDATKIEVSAMRSSGEGVAYKNDYWPNCGIQ